MQLLARQSTGELVLANQARKGQAYACLECGKAVRLRGGIHRQLHFYHLEPLDTCRQHQKGMVHLQVQLYFHRLLGEEDCLLEHHLPEINRIADVAWVSKKIVFEIQYSPISAKEVLERNRDYLALGWTVVWILHDQRFNQARYSAAEEALRDSPHYYTNINQQGIGMIYDQFDHLEKGWRHHQLPSLSIDVKGIKKCIPSLSSGLQVIRRRLQRRPFYFEGDLIDLACTRPDADYLQWVIEKEKLIRSGLKLNAFSLGTLLKKISDFYKIFFHHLLEKASR